MSNKVTYAEIIEALSRTTGFSKQKSEAFIKALIAEVKTELQENGKASITNFGSFKVKEVADRQGQNPQTGEPITIPAHKRVTFTPYKALREEVNAKYGHLESELIGERKEKPRTESEAVPAIFEEVKLAGTNVEPEPDIEKDGIVEEEPRSFDRRERARGNNIGLIMVAVLVLVVVGLASTWLFLGTDEPEQTAMNVSAQTEQEASVPQEPESEGPTEAMDQEPSKNEMMTEEETVREEPQPVQNPETVEQTSSGTVINGNTYQVKKDEWYWVIAEKVYGKSRFWPLIFVENQSVDSDPDKLYPSSGLEVPEMEGTAENPTKGDYGNLANASRVVSEAYLNVDKTEKAEEYARFANKWERLSQ